MEKEIQQILRKEINNLILKRLSLQQCNDVKIIFMIKEIIEILNKDFREEDVQGFIFKWNSKTEQFSLETYPSKVFPEWFALDKARKKELLLQMGYTTCNKEERTEICSFFIGNDNTILRPLHDDEDEELEVYQIEFF